MVGSLGGYKHLSIFSVVNKLSRTFLIFTPKTPNLPVQSGLKKMYYFAQQFMTFPGLLKCLPPKIPPWPSGVVGEIFFLGSNHSQIYPHMHAKFGHDMTVVSGMGGYRQTDKGTL